MAICEWLAAQQFFAGAGAVGITGMDSWQSESSGGEVVAISALSSTAGQNGCTTITAIISNASLGTQRNMNFPKTYYNRNRRQAQGWLDDAFQYYPGIHSQAFGDLGQSGERHVHLAAFDFTHVGAVNFTIVGKQFLRPAFCLA